MHGAGSLRVVQVRSLRAPPTRNLFWSDAKQLPFAEKLQVMEAIWEDLRAQAEKVPVPQWHRDLLDERRKAVEEGRDAITREDVLAGLQAFTSLVATPPPRT